MTARRAACVTCGRPMVYSRTAVPGYVRHNARGQCGACDHRDRRAGVVPPKRKPRLGVCDCCGRPMIYSTRQRRGYVRHASHDLCSGCVSRARTGQPGPVERPRVLRRYAATREIDWVTVERIAAGITMPATRQETDAAIRRMLAHGISQRSIPERIGAPVTYRRVTRVAARNRMSNAA